MIVYGDALSMSLPGLAHAWYAFEDPDSNRPNPDEKNPGRKTRGLSPSFLNQKTKKPSDLLGSDGGRVPPMAYLVTPTGLEQSQETQGNRGFFGICPPPVTPSLSTMPLELVELWPTLTDSQQAELLRVARAMADHSAALDA
jgi:hypothetical protein